MIVLVSLNAEWGIGSYSRRQRIRIEGTIVCHLDGAADRIRDFEGTGDLLGTSRSLLAEVTQNE